jgi:hypothetical protein
VGHSRMQRFEGELLVRYCAERGKAAVTQLPRWEQLSPATPFSVDTLDLNSRPGRLSVRKTTDAKPGHDRENNCKLGGVKDVRKSALQPQCERLTRILLLLTHFRQRR